jgi:hypothetical protein
MTFKESACLFAVALQGLSSVSTVLAQNPDHSNDPRNLRVRAAKARAAGLAQVELGPFEGQPSDVATLDEAVKNYSLFVVTPLTAETAIENGREILTWNKARVSAKLSTAPSSELAPPSLSSVAVEILPRELPSARNEIMLLHNGGTALVDGVTFTEKVLDFPALTVGKDYLCLLLVSADGKVGIMPLGGAGVFEIAAGDTLRPLAAHPHPVIEDILRSFANSLTQLSFHLRESAGR